MSKSYRNPLEWVRRNRQPPPPGRIGALARGLLRPGWEADVALRESVRACIDRLVDDTFRECCRLGKVDRRSVEILADSPAAAAALRPQWLMRLLAAFERECRFAGSPRIRFRCGTGGDPFSSPRESGDDPDSTGRISRPQRDDLHE